MRTRTKFGQQLLMKLVRLLFIVFSNMKRMKHTGWQTRLPIMLLFIQFVHKNYISIVRSSNLCLHFFVTAVWLLNNIILSSLKTDGFQNMGRLTWLALLTPILFFSAVIVEGVASFPSGSLCHLVFCTLTTWWVITVSSDCLFAAALATLRRVSDVFDLSDQRVPGSSWFRVLGAHMNVVRALVVAYFNPPWNPALPSSVSTELCCLYCASD
jgi:hypothetical protein